VCRTGGVLPRLLAIQNSVLLTGEDALLSERPGPSHLFPSLFVYNFGFRVWNTKRVRSQDRRHTGNKKCDLYYNCTAKRKEPNSADRLVVVPEVVPEIDTNTEHKRLTLYTRTLLLLSRPQCWNKHCATRTTRRDTTRTTRRACRVVTCRDVTQRVELGLWRTLDRYTVTSTRQRILYKYILRQRLLHVSINIPQSPGASWHADWHSTSDAAPC